MSLDPTDFHLVECFPPCETRGLEDVTSALWWVVNENFNTGRTIPLRNNIEHLPASYTIILPASEQLCQKNHISLRRLNNHLLHTMFYWLSHFILYCVVSSASVSIRSCDTACVRSDGCINACMYCPTLKRQNVINVNVFYGYKVHCKDVSLQRKKVYLRGN